ncbi:MAG: hypothetical protein IIC64_06300, partial [SAR324 cluster bacterium]|nr:hypothetical protein [SAR324 cluster bacterium]
MAVLLHACGDGGGEGTEDGNGKIFANRVLDYLPVNSTNATSDDWPYFFQPDAILGEAGAFTNVVSLGY